MKRSLIFCRISSTLNLPRDSCSLDWHFSKFGWKADRSGRPDEFSHTQGEGMERCCIAPRVLRGRREPSMPPKKKKGDNDGKGKDAKGDGDKPKAKATGPSASTHFLLLQQCVPDNHDNSAHSRSSSVSRLTPASIPSTGPSTASMS